MDVTWTIILSVLAPIGLLLASVAFKVLSHLVSEEVEGRLDQVGYAVLRLACRRLPIELRKDYYQEWAAELDAHFLYADERPLTRLYWSLRFPGSLLFRARSFARIQNPAAFKKVPNSLVQIVRTSRPFRIITVSISTMTAVLVGLTTAFQGGLNSPVSTISFVILFTTLALLTVWFALREWASATAARTGRWPRWTPPPRQSLRR